jgi:hypothetical protein
MAYDIDTELNPYEHMEYLNKIVSYAGMTHVGDPDSQLLSPCSIRGYRVVYSARPKLEWVRPTTSGRAGESPLDMQGDAAPLETVWNWWDKYGGDQIQYFNYAQRNDIEGSWVLVSGATVDGASLDTAGATAKWFVSSQQNLETSEAETADGLATGLGNAWSNGAWFWKKWYTNVSQLQRWSSENRNATSGIGVAGSTKVRTGSSAAFPRLGATENIWWVHYGERQILGFTKCEDDHIHGHDNNWSANQITDDIFNVKLNTTPSSAGGMVPQLIFYGGDVHGVQATPLMDNNGDILGASITDPGTTVVLTDTTNPAPPGVSISMPDHYEAFEATTEITTDADEIRAKYPQLFRTPQEIRALLCDGYADPLAQTFRVPEGYSDGIFIDSVDLCFGRKPNIWGPPVYVEIRTTVNGVPSSDFVLEHSVVEKQVNKVNIADAINSNIQRSWENPLDITQLDPKVPNFISEDSYTRFNFSRPIYLESNQEYAIVVRSNSTDYECWYASTDGSIVKNMQNLLESNQTVNKNTGTYTKQFQGVMFRSQNGRTWTENQQQDLMFRINKCKWNASKTSANTAAVELRAGNALTKDYLYDRLKINLNSVKAPGVDTSVTTTVYTTPESTGVLTGYKTLTTEEVFGEGSDNAIHDLAERMKFNSTKSQSQADLKLHLSLSTKNPHVAPMIDATECFVVPIKNNINNGDLSASDINVLTVGAGYTADESPTFTVNGGGSTSNAEFTVDIDSGTTVVNRDSVVVTDGGSGFHNSEGINISRTSGTAPTTEATFEILSEENITGGNSKQRYITKNINLAPEMSARGIRVFLTAIKPIGSNIYVYFRAKSESDNQNINRRKWQLMNQTAPTDYSATDPFSIVQYREYQFDTDEIISYQATNDDTGDIQTFNDFKTFAVKVVCYTENTTKPPIISDFRAIAVY